MREKPMDSWRVRAAVSEALDVFSSDYMQEVWTKALARREGDPEGAVTSARNLLESVCKHILDDAGKEYFEGLALPKLYKLTAEVLELAPDENTEPIFKELFTACAEMVVSIGRLRNHLSDSHGRGPFGTMPNWRHAELAVNLSAAMATYLAAVWAGRQPTIKDVLGRFIANAELTDSLGTSQKYTLELLMRSDIGKIIPSKLQTGDLIAHCESRLAKGTLPQTIHQDITYLRVALGQSTAALFDKAVPILRAKKLIGKSIPRERRVSHDEYDALINHFRLPPKKAVSGFIPMVDVMEFALWSGRSIEQICSLRWADVDFRKHTCKIAETGEEFPVLEKAWDVIEARSKDESLRRKERIFPYNPKSVGAKHTLAKKLLRKQVKEDMVFNDLRYEAVSRLLEKGHAPHEVAEATGQDFRKVAEIHRKLKATLAVEST